MSFLTTNRIVEIIDNKVVLENYQTNPDANFRTTFSDWPDEKITALALLIDVLWENDIECNIRNEYEDAESVILGEEDDINELISDVKVYDNSIKISDEKWIDVTNYSIEDFQQGKVKDLPMIRFEIYFKDEKILSDIPKSLVGESVSDTGMEMY